MYNEYVNGYVQRVSGKYIGELSIDGIRLQGGISAVYFEDGGEKYLWIKRKKVLEYNFESQSYRERDARPQFEAYLKKTVGDSTVSYKGEFVFMRFKYSIVGIWDKILGADKNRLNLFVERLPESQQTIINNINKAKKTNK